MRRRSSATRLLSRSPPSPRWPSPAAVAARAKRARAPPPNEFPSAKGKTIAQLLHDSGAKPTKLVIAPAAQVFDIGENRYPFGVFTLGGEQVDDADVALYFAKDGKAAGDRARCRRGSPRWRPSPPTAPSGTEGPGEATTVYVVPKVDFDRRRPLAGDRDAEGQERRSKRRGSPRPGRRRSTRGSRRSARRRR